MSSIAASLGGLGVAVGNLVSSFVFSTTEKVTSKNGKDGWITDNINKGRFDKYYMVIAGVNALNLMYYLVCSWAYGPTVDQLSKVMTEENGSKEEDSTEIKNVNPLFDDKVSDSSKEKELTEFKNGLKEEELTKD
jgi:peptide/histidine transporter 3/4